MREVIRNEEGGNMKAEKCMEKEQRLIRKRDADLGHGNNSSEES